MKKIKIIVAIAIIIAIAISTYIFKPQDYILKIIYKTDYSDYIYKYSEENNLNPYLIFSIIKNESNFNKNIESSSGAIGLMQLMESTAVEMANTINEGNIVKESLYNPEINIKIGTSYFTYLLKHYSQNEALALAAYNAGMGNVDNWIKDRTINKDGSNLENIPYKETNSYVRKILRDYKIYKDLYSEK